MALCFIVGFLPSFVSASMFGFVLICDIVYRSLYVPTHPNGRISACHRLAMVWISVNGTTGGEART
jgi:hypothetical protein